MEETQTKSIPSTSSGTHDYNITFSGKIVGIKTFTDPVARIISATYSDNVLSIHCAAYSISARTVSFTCFVQ